MTTPDTCTGCGQPLKVTGSIGEVDGDTLTKFYVHEDGTPQCAEPAKPEPLDDTQKELWVMERVQELRATIAERDKTIEELEGRHSLHHIPTLERVMEAHSSMPVSAWEIGQHWVGHREYRQAADESCYLCALAILLEKAEGESSAALRLTIVSQANWIAKIETKNTRLREALEKFGGHPIRCGLYDIAPKGCTCGLDAAKGESWWI